MEDHNIKDLLNGSFKGLDNLNKIYFGGNEIEIIKPHSLMTRIIYF